MGGCATQENLYQLDRLEVTMYNRAEQNTKNCIVYKGVQYKSKACLCEKFGVKYETVHKRSKELGSFIAAMDFTVEKKRIRGTQLHLGYGEAVVIDGITFETLTAACRHYGAGYNAVINRLKKGMGLEASIKESIHKKKNNEIKCNGKTYASKLQLAKAVGIPYCTLNSRIKRGKTTEEAVVHKEYKGHKNEIGTFNGKLLEYNGKQYDSLKEMAKEVGTSYSNLRYRLISGMEVKEAIEKELRAVLYQVEYNGKVYKNRGELAKKYGIKYSTLVKRILAGKTIAEAVETPVVQRKNNKGIKKNADMEDKGIMEVMKDMQKAGIMETTTPAEPISQPAEPISQQAEPINQPATLESLINRRNSLQVEIIDTLETERKKINAQLKQEKALMEGFKQSIKVETERNRSISIDDRVYTKAISETSDRFLS